MAVFFFFCSQDLHLFVDNLWMIFALIFYKINIPKDLSLLLPLFRLPFGFDLSREIHGTDLYILPFHTATAFVHSGRLWRATQKKVPLFTCNLSKRVDQSSFFQTVLRGTLRFRHSSLSLLETSLKYSLFICLFGFLLPCKRAIVIMIARFSRSEQRIFAYITFTAWKVSWFV